MACVPSLIDWSHWLPEKNSECVKCSETYINNSIKMSMKKCIWFSIFWKVWCIYIFPHLLIFIFIKLKSSETGKRTHVQFFFIAPSVYSRLRICLNRGYALLRCFPASLILTLFPCFYHHSLYGTLLQFRGSQCHSIARCCSCEVGTGLHFVSGFFFKMNGMIISIRYIPSKLHQYLYDSISEKSQKNNFTPIKKGSLVYVLLYISFIFIKRVEVFFYKIERKNRKIYILNFNFFLISLFLLNQTIPLGGSRGAKKFLRRGAAAPTPPTLPWFTRLLPPHW